MTLCDMGGLTWPCFHHRAAEDVMEDMTVCRATRLLGSRFCRACKVSLPPFEAGQAGVRERWSCGRVGRWWAQRSLRIQPELQGLWSQRGAVVHAPGTPTGPSCHPIATPRGRQYFLGLRGGSRPSEALWSRGDGQGLASG